MQQFVHVQLKKKKDTGEKKEIPRLSWTAIVWLQTINMVPKIKLHLQVDAFMVFL